MKVSHSRAALTPIQKEAWRWHARCSSAATVLTATAEYEVGIIGAGPAGLSAALILGRCRRRVVVYDSGKYRNACSHAMHGFLSRDGIAPEELRKIGRREIACYETVEFRDVAVNRVGRGDGRFMLEAADGSRAACTTLLLATGLIDKLPEVQGARELYGNRLFHCVYCDGWELRDQPLAAYTRNEQMARTLTQWSRDVVLCTDGDSGLEPGARDELRRDGIAVDERPIARFERDGEGVRLVFRAGAPLSRRAVFFHLGCRAHARFAQELGCELDEKGGVKVNRFEASCVPGLYVAGDASRDILLAVVAAGEGAAAAVAINSALAKVSAR